MVTTLLVTVCMLSLAPGDPTPTDLNTTDDPRCEEVVVKDSSRDPEFGFMACATSMFVVAEWKENSLLYRGDEWVVMNYKCAIGSRPEKARVRT